MVAVVSAGAAAAAACLPVQHTMAEGDPSPVASEPLSLKVA